jgi:membrane associated rhomboid family serine protease
VECPRCEGSGKCPDCGGQGWITCPSCDGSGERSSSRGGTYPCRSCKGQGKIECTVSCASCEGSGQITQELQQKVREKYNVRWDSQLPLYRFTNVVIALCILLWVLGQFNRDADTWMVVNLSNLSGAWSQPWRLLTSAFLHAGIVHLVMNMLSILRYGPLLEGLYGTLRFAALYLVAAVVGSALSSWGHIAFQQQAVFALGASGAGYGLFGAILGAHQRHGYFERQQVQELLGWVGINTLVLVFVTSGIDHWAHAGGFLAGFAYAWLTPRPRGR